MFNLNKLITFSLVVFSTALAATPLPTYFNYTDAELAALKTIKPPRT